MTTNAKWVKMCVLAALFGSVGTGNIWGDTFPSIQSVQQSNKVTGLVCDDMGPVAGASISVKGTSNGTISDADGKFELNNLKKGTTLVISFVGLETQEIVWDGQSVLNVNLKSDT